MSEWKKDHFVVMRIFPFVHIGQEEFGTKTELKNLNSFNYVRRGIGL